MCHPCIEHVSWDPWLRQIAASWGLDSCPGRDLCRLLWALGGGAVAPVPSILCTCYFYTTSDILRACGFSFLFFFIFEITMATFHLSCSCLQTFPSAFPSPLQIHGLFCHCYNTYVCIYTHIPKFNLLSPYNISCTCVFIGQPAGALFPGDHLSRS